MTSHVAVVTMTWARNEAEEQLLTRSLARLAGTGLPIAVADRGNSDRFSAALAGMPGVRVVTSRDGLVAQVQASMRVAADFGRASILYTEPDKEFFFANRLAAFLRRATAHDESALVLAARSEHSFATYPSMQRYTEGVINELCGKFLGPSGDFCYGPFMLPTTLATHVDTVDAHLGWGWRPAMFRAARQRGMPIRLDVDDFPCPVDQRSETPDDQAHRLRQLSQNVLGLIA